MLNTVWKIKQVIDQVQAEKNNVRFRRLWYGAKDNGRFDLHALNGEAKISDTESARALEIWYHAHALFLWKCAKNLDLI